jgi:hypothetical protein
VYRLLTALLVALGITYGLSTAPVQAPAPAQVQTIEQPSPQYAAAGAQATPTGWGKWLMPTGQICVQTGGSTYWPIAQAVAAINKTDANIVAKASCTGYKRSMTIIIRGYTSSTDGACANAYSAGGSFTWTYVRGVWTWVPNAPVVNVNFWYRMKAACQNTYRKRLYLMSHEILHILGLAHATGVTVMLSRVNETYVVPQWIDIYRINRRY